MTDVTTPRTAADTAPPPGIGAPEDDLPVLPHAAPTPAGVEAARPPSWFARQVTPARLRGFAGSLVPPVLGIGGFLVLWAVFAARIDTSLGTLPGPGAVWDAGVGLWAAFLAPRDGERAFYAAQDATNVQRAAEGLEPHNFVFNGPVTFVDQIWTSLRTVMLGFAIGTFIAVPIGLLSGLSKTFNGAINPLVQIFRPVSPLAWLPIVTVIISAAITSSDPLLPKAFIISALVVTLCSLWPTLINTSVGASSVPKDLINVADVAASRGIKITTTTCDDPSPQGPELPIQVFAPAGSPHPPPPPPPTTFNPFQNPHQTTKKKQQKTQKKQKQNKKKKTKKKKQQKKNL